MADELLTVVEVAGRAKVSVKSVRRAIERGELVAQKVCGRWRIWETDYLAWVTSGRPAPRGTNMQPRPPESPEVGSLGALRRIEAEAA